MQHRYTIGQLAELSGVSARTLRHYEDRDLLHPARTEAGYRVYTKRDAQRLAQVLAMRACNLPLTTIRRLLDDPQAKGVHAALVAHLRALEAQGESLDEAMVRTRRAIATIERMGRMDEKTAFEMLKAEGLERFERDYGEEARRRYGDEAIDATNERMMALSRDEWDAKELLEESIKVQLRIAKATGDPESEASRELARMHERWIRIHWSEGYTREAHLSLVRGYPEDGRFRRYYDEAAGEGATEFLVRAVCAA